MYVPNDRLVGEVASMLAVAAFFSEVGKYMHKTRRRLRDTARRSSRVLCDASAAEGGFMQPC